MILLILSWLDKFLVMVNVLIIVLLSLLCLLICQSRCILCNYHLGISFRAIILGNCIFSTGFNEDEKMAFNQVYSYYNFYSLDGIISIVIIINTSILINTLYQ